jgi:hypothetical protein
MLISAWDPRQWTYLRNLPKKKKKQNLSINQCGEKGGWGRGGITYPTVWKFQNHQFRGKKKKNHGINPGQPAGQGREKKTLVLTLGSPPEKGGKTKTLVLTLGSPPEKGEKKEKRKERGRINLWQPAGKGRGKKKPPRFNPGQHAGKGRKRKRKKKVLFGRGPKTVGWYLDGQTSELIK